MSTPAERLYGLLLRAYPRDFRADYEREMRLAFRDLCREKDARSLRFWAAVIGDVARSAPALHVEGWRRQGHLSTQMEGTMKLAAIVTVLIGLLGIVNAGVELVAGGTSTTPHGLALLLSVGASVLLLVAAGAIARPGGRGRQLGRVALFASVVCIVAARLVHPWMSVFALLIGVGFPIGVLIALSWPGRASPLTHSS